MEKNIVLQQQPVGFSLCITEDAGVTLEPQLIHRSGYCWVCSGNVVLFKRVGLMVLKFNAGLPLSELPGVPVAVVPDSVATFQITESQPLGLLDRMVLQQAQETLAIQSGRFVKVGENKKLGVKQARVRRWCN
ncbi:hypothetical protein [Salmonirosea aquatica]|uniref:Uncharacterized protein n=1 Tax=Salmonirosea aquatica TaxID=2654236 RepID=A0A7C9BVB4_9BACT|nr:hypothetical protein [Cytophagaceae bacterium SJW1-29]